MLTLCIGILLVAIYTVVLCIKNKCIPPSISETFYLGGKYWFTATLFVSSILIAMGLLDLSYEPWQFISFLTAAGMALVGAAPHFHDYEHKIHYAGAITLLVGSQIWICLFSSPWILVAWLSALVWFKTKQRMFWCEILCILTVAVSLFFIK